jgi:hypothetical protein
MATYRKTDRLLSFYLHIVLFSVLLPDFSEEEDAFQRQETSLTIG